MFDNGFECVVYCGLSAVNKPPAKTKIDFGIFIFAESTRRGNTFACGTFASVLLVRLSGIDNNMPSMLDQTISGLGVLGLDGLGFREFRGLAFYGFRFFRISGFGV